MNDHTPEFEPVQSAADAREMRRNIIFNANTLDAALEQVIRYARVEIDKVFAVNGLPRSVLPWRMPAEICTASAVLAAHHLAEGREDAGAEMLAHAMFETFTDCVVEGLCVAEDLAIVTDNFTERFGDEA